METGFTKYLEIKRDATTIRNAPHVENVDTIAVFVVCEMRYVAILNIIPDTNIKTAEKSNSPLLKTVFAFLRVKKIDRTIIIPLSNDIRDADNNIVFDDESSVRE
jgi:hypothetical protein